MHDRAAAVHHSAPVLCGSYGWCAAISSSSALAATTGAAGAGLGCPRLQSFGLEDDDVSMTSAAVWERRVLLRDPMFVL